jgi:hypothetical protein
MKASTSKRGPRNPLQLAGLGDWAIYHGYFDGKPRDRNEKLQGGKGAVQRLFSYEPKNTENSGPAECSAVFSTTLVPGTAVACVKSTGCGTQPELGISRPVAVGRHRTSVAILCRI